MIGYYLFVHQRAVYGLYIGLAVVGGLEFVACVLSQVIIIIFICCQSTQGRSKVSIAILAL